MSWTGSTHLAILLAGLLAGTTSLSEVELIDVDVEKIQGDTAYVATESGFRGKTNFERLIVKRVNGQWRIAGKQR
jgi:hypothetical protein